MIQPEDPLISISRRAIAVQEQINQVRRNAHLDWKLSVGFLFSAGLYKFIEINQLPTPDLPIYSGREIFSSLILAGYSFFQGINNFSYARNLRMVRDMDNYIIYHLAEKREKE